jgi:hypothetical protein
MVLDDRSRRSVLAESAVTQILNRSIIGQSISLAGLGISMHLATAAPSHELTVRLAQGLIDVNTPRTVARTPRNSNPVPISVPARQEWRRKHSLLRGTMLEITIAVNVDEAGTRAI